MKEEKIRCLLVEPYELPKEIEIDNTLEAKQDLVGGYIECTYLQSDPRTRKATKRNNKR